LLQQRRLTALAYFDLWVLARAAVSLLHAFALAPTTNLADALAVVASVVKASVRMGARCWVGCVRVASIAAGFVVSAFGLVSWSSYRRS
jgi:hypothetical protein